MSLIKAFNSIKNKLVATSLSHTKSHSEPGIVKINSDPVVMQALADVLKAEDISFEWKLPRLVLAGGMSLEAEPVEAIVLAEGRVRTCTKIHIHHPEYFPEGIAEYQHAMGADEALSMAEGFRAWTQMDLVALVDATREVPKDCTVIEMSVVAGADETTARFRQVILGPVAHLASQAAPEKKEEHPFCPCCLFTESTAAFHDLLQTDKFLGVRLFASRDNEGKFAADCRVNGEDFAPALELLTAYASKWPERGLEFRKQYVVIRSVTRSVKSGVKPSVKS